MTDQYLDDQLSFEYLLGRLSEQERSAFEATLMTSRALREDVFVSAMLVEMIREYALVCSRESFKGVAVT